jgi:hypothetical protein
MPAYPAALPSYTPRKTNKMPEYSAALIHSKK